MSFSPAEAARTGTKRGQKRDAASLGDDHDDGSPAAKAPTPNVDVSIAVSIVPIVAKNLWFRARDLAVVERICRDGRGWIPDVAWRTTAIRDVWKPSEFEFGQSIQDGNLPPDLAKICPTARDLFINFPRAWIEAEIIRIKADPKWTKLGRYVCSGNRGGARCLSSVINGGGDGAHGYNAGYLIDNIRWRPGHRYVKKDQDNEEPSTLVVRYGEEGASRINANRMCPGCFFDQLHIHHFLRGGDYNWEKDFELRPMKTLFDLIYDEIVSGDFDEQCTSIFLQAGVGMDEHWGNFFGVEADDAAIVVAYALIQENAIQTWVDLPTLQSVQRQLVHIFDSNSEQHGLGSKGYTALAFALSINSTLEGLRTPCICSLKQVTSAEDAELDGEALLDRRDELENIYWKTVDSFTRAIGGNKESKLEKLDIFCETCITEDRETVADLDSAVYGALKRSIIFDD